MRFLADHDAFVTLPESPAGRLKAETPGFLFDCPLESVCGRLPRSLLSFVVGARLRTALNGER